jgi:hypothetical protein
LLGSVQKFGDTCSDELRLVFRFKAMPFAVSPNWVARARSAVFVYLLMVVNYQNWGDPFVVILALGSRSYSRCSPLMASRARSRQSLLGCSLRTSVTAKKRLNAGARRRAHMQLYLSGIDQRKEVAAVRRPMNAAFRDLAIGILFALPATFCGIVTMLYMTGTALSVPSLMGAIMAIGVASANSILLVTFAREQQLAGMRAFDAAIAAGRTRIRPVLMTAAAMIVGMIPMAIGGAGEEQNAALARAVIGGLLFATPTTLLVVPYLFAILRKGNDGKPARGVFAEELE